MQIFIVSLVLCVFFVLFLRRLAPVLGIVDLPGGRKLHSHATPTVGGLAMFVAVALGLLLGARLTGHVLSEDTQVLIWCAATMMMFGMLDDRFGLKVRVRFMVQIFLVLVVINGADATIPRLGAIFGSEIYLGMFAVPFSVVAFVGGINSVNMIDGADGMAGKMVLISLLGVMSLFCLSGHCESVSLVMALIGALVGFLLFNTRIFVKRAWVFMGDAGSMWLGLVLCWLLAQLVTGPSSVEPPIVLWLFGIPLLDTLTVMLRRKRRKFSMFEPDRTHIHHVLEDTGLPIRHAVWLLGGIQLILVGVGVLFCIYNAPAALVFWSFVALFVLYYFRLRDC